MLTVRSGPALGLVVEVALLATLDAAVGLTATAWVVGAACAGAVVGAVALGMARSGTARLGPADVVTLVRSLVACAVAALSAEAFLGRPETVPLLALAGLALALDAVDGRIARSTRTASAFGARFDGEADAFLMLVLSLHVAPAVGAWVVLIGVARYTFAAAGWLLPWLRRRLPRRDWRKVVTAVNGVVLTVVAADVLPRSWSAAALLAALALLAESFGRDVLWLRRHRTAADHRRGRRHLTIAGHVLALLLVWFALVAPNRVGDLSVGAFLRLPVEGLAVAALVLLLPGVAGRTVAVAAGVLLGVVALAKILDMGFYAALDRPFSPVTDRAHLGPALGFVNAAFGPVLATLATVVVVAAVGAVLVCMPLAVRRLTGLLARRPRPSLRALAALGAVWAVAATTGVELGEDRPLASATAGHLVVGKVRAAAEDARDLRRFETAVTVDRYRGTTDLLARLRGKDVLVVFVESYGRVTLEGLSASPSVRATLEQGSARLAATGFRSGSGFLTSPTTGALSWLAHSTLQSGVWVDNQLVYERLLGSDRLTLSRVFGREGWRTLAVKPANTGPWPEGRAFYGVDRVYGRANLGYRGPRFGFAKMPDQYALAALHRRELVTHPRPPVMAEVDLASSHSPWAPLPRMVGWEELGDGRIFDGIEQSARSAEELVRHPEEVEAAYAQSIVYCIDVLVAYVETYGDDDLVLLILGDHAPSPVVAGDGASHDVPVSLVARDPAVLAAVAGWGWDPGLLPGPDAPVWPMDAFRDRFLAAFSTPVGSVQAASPARP